MKEVDSWATPLGTRVVCVDASNLSFSNRPTFLVAGAVYTLRKFIAAELVELEELATPRYMSGFAIHRFRIALEWDE